MNNISSLINNVTVSIAAKLASLVRQYIGIKYIKQSLITLCAIIGSLLCISLYIYHSSDHVNIHTMTHDTIYSLDNEYVIRLSSSQNEPNGVDMNTFKNLIDDIKYGIASLSFNGPGNEQLNGYSLKGDLRYILKGDLRYINENMNRYNIDKLSLNYNYTSNYLSCDMHSSKVYEDMQKNKELYDDSYNTYLLEKCRSKKFTMRLDNDLVKIINRISNDKSISVDISRKPELFIGKQSPGQSQDHIGRKITVDHNMYSIDLLNTDRHKRDNLFMRQDRKCDKIGENKYGKQCIYVIILDTGIEPINEVKESIDYRYTYPYTAKSYDDNGHGTFCAGTINSKNIGINPNTALISVKLMDDKGIANDLDYIDKVFDHLIKLAHLKNGPFSKAKGIINMSFIDKDNDGNSGFKYYVDLLVKTNRYILVAAAGNIDDDSCLYSPGNSVDVINTGSIYLDPHPVHQSHKEKERKIMAQVSSFSNYGKCIDIWYYGDKIYGLTKEENKHTHLSGTSMSTPHVSAVVAWHLFNKNPEMTTEQVYGLLHRDSTKCIIDDTTSQKRDIVGTNSVLFMGDNNDEPTMCQGQVTRKLSDKQL